MKSPHEKPDMSARALKHLLQEKGNLTAPDSLLPTVTAQLGLENKRPKQWFEVQRHLGRVNVARQNGGLPRPQSGEVLVKMVACGICGADIRSVSRQVGYATTLGHEGVG